MEKNLSGSIREEKFISADPSFCTYFDTSNTFLGYSRDICNSPVEGMLFDGFVQSENSLVHPKSRQSSRMRYCTTDLENRPS